MTEQAELNAMIDRLYQVRERKRAMARELKDVEAEYRELEDLCVERLDDAGLLRAGTGSANMSLTEEVVPSADPENWENIRRWCIENDCQQMLPAKLNAGPYREFREMGLKVPWVDDHVKRKVSLTKVTKR